MKKLKLNSSYRKYLFIILLFLFFLSPAVTSEAQSTAAVTPGASITFDMTGFPQWSKDLRRGEIVAFGAFPFTFFFTSFFMDTYRTASHNWDMRYAPWPLKPAGAINMTTDEQLFTLGIAAGSAVIIAIIDHLVVRYDRTKREQEILSQPPGTPIIIRRPMTTGENLDNTELPGTTFPDKEPPAESPSEVFIPMDPPVPEALVP